MFSFTARDSELNNIVASDFVTRYADTHLSLTASSLSHIENFSSNIWKCNNINCNKLCHDWCLSNWLINKNYIDDNSDNSSLYKCPYCTCFINIDNLPKYIEILNKNKKNNIIKNIININRNDNNNSTDKCLVFLCIISILILMLLIISLSIK